MHLEGKVALVTGASRGIGQAIAQCLARDGADLILNSVTSEQLLEVADEIREMGREALAIHADVANLTEVRSMVEQGLNSFGRIDILVNNAGIIRRGTFLDHPPDEWQEVMSVNVEGAYNCCFAVTPSMLEHKSGRIVNISSIAGKVGDLASAPSYGPSKGAMNALTKSLARELAPHGITVNAVAPHAIETDMSTEWSDEKRRRIIDSVPMGKLGQPRDVGEAVAFLASDAAGFITGEILDVNGGYLMD